LVRPAEIDAIADYNHVAIGNYIRQDDVQTLAVLENDLASKLGQAKMRQEDVHFQGAHFKDTGQGISQLFARTLFRRHLARGSARSSSD
jgi:hypothetical protein